MRINEVTVREGDSLIFTIGDLSQNILPTEGDLKDWKKILNAVLKGDFIAAVPPIVELTVVHNIHKGDSNA